MLAAAAALVHAFWNTPWQFTRLPERSAAAWVATIGLKPIAPYLVNLINQFVISATNQSIKRVNYESYWISCSKQTISKTGVRK